MGAPEPSAARLDGIFVYPLKSAVGIALDATEVDEVGLGHDRRWMVVRRDGSFLSLRTHPRMAWLGTELADDALRVSAPGLGTLELPLEGGAAGPARERAIQVWREPRPAHDCGDEAATWISAFMEEPCRIVRAAAPNARRVTEDGWVLAGFADAQPALVISTASLDALNERLAEPLPMSRFRPNLVIAGVGPHDEDAWSGVRVGDVPVRLLRPCPRCAATTVDGETAEAGKEPLRTLATYRRGDDGQVYFGMNARFEGPGAVRVGDAVRA